MSEGTLNPSNAEESAYVRNQLIAFNAAHLSEDLKHRYEELNFNIKNEAGDIVAGVLSMTTLENAPTGHRHYYFKKDLT